MLAVDGVAARRELAATLGAEPVEPEQAAEAVAAATGGLGADVVIEAAGTPGALDASLRLARGRGTVSVVGAHFEPDYPLDNALMFEQRADAPLLDRRPDPGTAASCSTSSPPGDSIRRASITHRLPLAEAAEAYRLFDSREATKVVLTP